ncbi:MAG: hypothetical protein UT24_C0022G0014 [Candidatus Woesebacteria bacterium GW2011_GWB1_39_12]|uniref:Uncharacterized protein n=1 Tax=Candidatus Woesebacteria bacterium GW2011_GWB1_39_12 TaxID=1618574 RepID=A0A0G0M6X8_9BACT|nr:MAG: hypothetical protein UT24_C0022G0014 [Candidatus Woesebacteria bacterium GW2011_GWB1_39_12]
MLLIRRQHYDRDYHSDTWVYSAVNFCVLQPFVSEYMKKMDEIYLYVQGSMKQEWSSFCSKLLMNIRNHIKKQLGI